MPEREEICPSLPPPLLLAVYDAFRARAMASLIAQGICIVTGAWVTEIVMGDWCATAVKYSLTPPVPRGDDIGEADAADPATIDLVMQVDAVIVATGGFSASREVLETHVPDKAGLPTTNGAFATGDGIRLLQVCVRSRTFAVITPRPRVGDDAH